MHSQHSHDRYLETQILTASPQKLRLMLIEGALRFGRRAVAQWDSNENEAFRLSARMRDIVTELLSGTCGADSDVALKSKEVYIFLFRQMALAQLHKDVAKIEEVIRVLEIEQETWRQVCEIMPEAPERPEPKEITADDCPSEMIDKPTGNFIPISHLNINAPHGSPSMTIPAQGGFTLDA